MTYALKVHPAKALYRKAVPVIAAALLALAAASPASARSLSFNGFTFNDKEPLIEQLIALDARDIEELKSEFAEAREDITDAIDDIEDARRDVDGLGEAALNSALKVAARAIEKASGKAFDEALTEIARAERELVSADVDDAERAETQGAIDMLREEIAGLKSALSKLAASMRG